MSPDPVQARIGSAIGATLLAAVVWGTSFNVNDHGLAFVGPATFVVLRFALAGILVLVVLHLMGRLDTKLVREPWLWALALANGLGFLLQYLGQTLTTPARTALFVNTSVFFVALLERVLFRARVGPRRLATILVGVAGASLLVTGGDLSSLRGGQFRGDLIVLGGGFVWSLFAVYNVRAVRSHDMPSVTAWLFLLTSIVLLPALLLDARPLHVAPGGWWPVIYSGLVSTALAYGLWAYGLTRIRASTSTVLLLVEILVASLLSVVILRRETFGAFEVVGALLLLAAVMAMSLVSAEGPEAAS